LNDQDVNRARPGADRAPHTEPAPGADPAAGGVLVVDLDGTLVQSDMLHETFWASVSDDARAFMGSLRALRDGKAALKAYLAGRVNIDPATLPYDPRVLDRVRQWRAAGGRTALVTATDQGLAQDIARHLGLFDEVHGTTPGENLKGPAKAAFLIDRFGPKGYSYIGDSAADLPVWAGAAQAISVGAARSVRSALDASGTGAEHLPPPTRRAQALWRAMRPHQWLKNLLVLVPLVADRAFSFDAVAAVLLAFVALSLTASAGYVINDLLDLSDDRSHPRKRDRPFASGALSVQIGTALGPALLAAGLGAAALVSPALMGIVAVYFVSTVAYSVKLKRHNMVDICMLAFLFTLRVIAGAVAIVAPLSVWLMAFSMFLFLALAAVKRLGELTDAESAGRAVSRRGYRVEDRSVLSQIGVTSGYLAVLVFALYINEPEIARKYGAPWLLWGVCPLLLFWISRVVVIASRGDMQDDPLVWALQNRTSRKVIALVMVIIIGAVVL
jgi:4-hydroxybenzoate polyprenyltransferase/phosphoserine phosphatase